VSDFTKQGGEWLGAVRSYVQHKFFNGETVTWGSGDELRPPATIGQIEEVAALAVDSAFKEVDELKKEIERLRKKLLFAQLGISQTKGESDEG